MLAFTSKWEIMPDVAQFDGTKFGVRLCHLSTSIELLLQLKERTSREAIQYLHRPPKQESILFIANRRVRA